MTRMKTLVGLVAFGAALMIAAPAQADTYSFFRITNNGNTNVASQLFVDVTANGSQVDFTFTNEVGIASSITDIYFDDGSLLGIASISDSGVDVAFTQDANPSDLPGRNGTNPGFNTTEEFSADSDSPVSQNGVNSASESVTITFDLINGQTINDTLAALESGGLRIGLHIQAIGTTGGSDSYVNNPPVIPVPGAALLGAMGLGLVGGRRKKAAA